RLCPLRQKVVHAHGHEVDADGGVPARVDGNLELGTHPVVGRDQDRIAEACRFEVEEGPEPAEGGVRARSPRRGGKGLRGLPQGVAGIDIDPCRMVGNGGMAVRATWHGGAHRLPTFAQRLTEYCRHSRRARGRVGSATPLLWMPRKGQAGMGIAVRSAIARAGLALGACFTVAASTPCARAAGEEAAYTVGNYPVEARAENAVSAKSKALADGQQAALRSLLKRLVPVTAHQRLRALREVSAGDLIEGVRVRSERNSSTDYIANLDFTFQ